MTSPVPDALRTQLAQVLAEHRATWTWDQARNRMLATIDPPEKVADALLPTIAAALARARAEGAAEALREAADAITSEATRTAGHGITDQLITAGQWVAAQLVADRAAALSAPTTTEGDPT